MLAALAALAVYAAMGSVGVAALRRANLGLEPLEQVAFGVPAGVAAATLSLIPLASAFGLSAALVAAVALACAAAAVALWPERPSLPAILSAFQARVERLGILSLVAAPTWLGARVPAGWWRKAVPFLLSLFPILVIGTLVVRWVFFWRSVITFEAGGMWAGHTFLWSDWPAHLGDATNFAYGDNFPPENPKFPGHPYAYHYLASVTGAALIKLGLQPASALELPNFLASVFIALGVYALARRLTGARGAATLAVVLFLFGGGLGWLMTAREIDAAHSVRDVLLRGDPWRYGDYERANIRIVPYFFRTAVERGYTFGLPLAMLTLTLLYLGIRTGRRRCFLAAGGAAGLMPLAHLSSLMAVALIGPFLFLLRPSRDWFLALAVWIPLAVPQLWSQVGESGGDASAIRLQIGWVAPPDPWVWFWIKNLGWFIPVLACALLDRRLMPTTARRFLWAFMPIFPLANLLVFQPWDGDNTKVLMYWFLGASILSAALLAKAWREAKAPVMRVILAGVVVMMTLSGALADLDQALGKDRLWLMSSQEIRFADVVRANTPPHARILVGLQHNHPVPVLAGRQVVMTFPGWAWAYGIPDWDRERDVKAIYAFGPDAPRLLEKYGVDYLVLGPYERNDLDANVDAIRARYPRVIRIKEYGLYQVRGTDG